jgi:adenosylcobinamide-GDP ribazoletransferase
MTFLYHQLRLFFIALQFFTRLPIPRWVGFEQAWLQQSSRYLPLVGLLVAALTASVYFLAHYVWPHPIAVLLSTAFGIYLTGAFHEDGFADVCDGFGGAMSSERVLDIMQDSRVGAFGVIGVVLLIGLKCLTLSYLPAQYTVAGLLVAHPLSRLASLVVIRWLPYIRPAGKVKVVAQTISSQSLAIAIITGILPVIVIVLSMHLSWHIVAGAMLAAAGTAFIMGRRFKQRIGGYTGDCLGAIQQVAEVSIYLVVSAFIAAN